MILDVAQALLDDIDAAVAGEPCELTRTFISAGEPASPNPGCTEISVWVSRLSNAEEFAEGCRIATELELSYRIDWCYSEPDDGTGPTAEDHLEAATCFYDLVDAVWCGIVSAYDSGTLAGISECEQINLGQLVTDPRQSGNVSATGTVTVRYDCSTGS